MRTRRTIRGKMLAAFGVVVSLLIILIIVSWIMLGNSIAAVELARDTGYAGAMLAKDMQFDAMQVWQWLTDISATRGAEGLDDGFDQAEIYAEHFLEDTEDLLVLHPDNEAELEALTASFATFYVKGKEMA